MPRPLLAVQVITFAHVPRAVLQRAEADGSAIYDLAGITVIWSNKLPEEIDAPEVDHWVRVVLHAGTRSERLSADVSAARNTMGFAPCAVATVERCRTAYIFYDRVEQAARVAAISVGRVLGLTMAHEIGHMLLPRPSHSPDGIMRPSLDLEHAMLPQFSAVQANLIRTKLAQNR